MASSNFGTALRLTDGRIIEKRLSDYMWKQATRLWREGMKAFLNGVVRSPGFSHIDTGMSMGSLIPVARELRFRYYEDAVELLAGHPRTGVTNIDRSYDGTRDRSVEEGIRVGKRSYTLDYGTPQKPEFIFEITIAVYQYSRYEPQWQTLDAGAKAFEDFINLNADKFIKSTKLNELLNPFSI